MLLELRQLKIKPGQQLLLEDVSWQQFENILADLGEHRAARVSYSHGYLEIISLAFSCSGNGTIISKEP